MCEGDGGRQTLWEMVGKVLVDGREGTVYSIDGRDCGGTARQVRTIDAMCLGLAGAMLGPGRCDAVLG